MKNFIMNLTQKQKMIILIVVILVAGLGIFGLFKYLYSEEKISDGLQNSVDQLQHDLTVLEEISTKTTKNAQKRKQIYKIILALGGDSIRHNDSPTPFYFSCSKVSQLLSIGS